MSHPHENVLGIVCDNQHRRRGHNGAQFELELANHRDNGDTRAFSLKHVTFLNHFNNVDAYHTVVFYQQRLGPNAHEYLLGDPNTYTMATANWAIVPPGQYSATTLIDALNAYNATGLHGYTNAQFGVSAAGQVTLQAVDPVQQLSGTFRLLSEDEVAVFLQVAGVRAALNLDVDTYLAANPLLDRWDPTDSRTTLGRLLGSPRTVARSVPAQVYYADGLMNLSGPGVVFLRTNALASGSYTGSSNQSHNWVRGIPVLSAWGDVEHYLPSIDGHDTMLVRSDTSLTNIDFSFEDSLGRPLHLPTNTPVVIDGVLLLG